MFAPPGLQPFASLFARERSRTQLFADRPSLDPQGIATGLQLLPLFRREVPDALPRDGALGNHPVALRPAIERLTGTAPHLPTHHCAAPELTARTHLCAWTELSAPAGLHLPTHRHVRPGLSIDRIGRKRPPARWASLTFQ